MSSNEEILEALDEHNLRLLEIRQDINEARLRGADLSELYAAMNRMERKMEAMEEEVQRRHHHQHYHLVHQVRYDDYSVVSTSVVGRQSDRALRLLQKPDPVVDAPGKPEPIVINPKKIRHGSNK